jgi:hypothetical protein
LWLSVKARNDLYAESGSDVEAIQARKIGAANCNELETTIFAETIGNFAETAQEKPRRHVLMLEAENPQIDIGVGKGETIQRRPEKLERISFGQLAPDRGNGIVNDGFPCGLLSERGLYIFREATNLFFENLMRAHLTRGIVVSQDKRGFGVSWWWRGLGPNEQGLVVA